MKQRRRGLAPAPVQIDDGGGTTVFVVVLSVALLAMAGLVVDGGFVLAARQEAAATAEEAARAGADAISIQSVRTGGPVHVDASAANAAVTRFLESSGHRGSASVRGDTVTVTVQITRQTAILSAVGIRDLSASATASARGLTGIDREEPQPGALGREHR